MATQEIPDQKKEFFSVASRFVGSPDDEFIDLIYPPTGPGGRCVARTILSLLSVNSKLDLKKSKDLAIWISRQNYSTSLNIVDLFLALEDEDKLEGRYLLKMLNQNECSIARLRDIIEDPRTHVCILIELYDDASGNVEQHLAHINSIEVDSNGVVVSIESRSDRASVQSNILMELNKGASFSIFIVS